MTVYLVGAGPGDPGLLTRRGAQLLSEADVVLYDRLVHHSILALAPETAELIDVGKRPDGSRPGAASQVEINQLLVDYGQRKHIVVRLKGGDPFVFGRGGEEVEVLTRAGVRWEVVPGISSAFAVPAVVGIPVTHRGLSSSVTVVTGRTDDPTAPGSVNWEALAKVDGTVVILMGMMNRAEIAEALMRGGRPASTPTAVIERGTTPEQAVVRTTLGQLTDVPLGSPSVIVVGPVADLGADPAPPELADLADLTDLTDLTDPGDLVPGPPLWGRTVVVTRSGPRARGLVAALHDAGAATIEIPLTEQADPLDQGAALRAAATDVGRFRWVILTSVNAVTRFMAELRDARSLGGTLVAAVGPATADALRRAGVEPDLVPAEHWANGLVAEFPDREPANDPPDNDPPGNLVLFPCADQAPMTIPEGLSSKGWDVHRVEAYRTVALPPPNDEVLAKLADADAVVFTAGSSATAYVALHGPDGRQLRVPPLVVCIGPTTSGVARALGMHGVEEAHGPSTEGIVAALIHHLDGPPAGGS
jgi:uroporphyrinogen III methyltransferase / synthase